jgi:hypothetical protein
MAALVREPRRPGPRHAPESGVTRPGTPEGHTATKARGHQETQRIRFRAQVDKRVAPRAPTPPAPGERRARSRSPIRFRPPPGKGIPEPVAALATMREPALIGNLQRKALTAFEEAEAPDGPVGLRPRRARAPRPTPRHVAGRTSVTGSLALNGLEDIRNRYRLPDISFGSLLLRGNWRGAGREHRRPERRHAPERCVTRAANQSRGTTATKARSHEETPTHCSPCLRALRLA